MPGNVQINRSQIIGIALTIAVIAILHFVGKSATGRNRAYLQYASGLVTAGGLAFWVGTITPQLDNAITVLKTCTALVACSAVFFEIRRVQERRPVALRWKKLVGVALGVLSIVLYFNGFKVGYAKFWHRHDQYHYYFGAKYFRELGYDGLYKCTVIAEDEIGQVNETFNGQHVVANLSHEVHAPDKKIRNLGGDNLLMPAEDTLAHPEQCDPTKKSADGKVVSDFSPERWEEFKKDIKFFRLSTPEHDYWDGMAKDHGYNPPPVWTLTGYLIASGHDATEGFMQFLGLIDEFYIVAMFAAIYWAFGWRIFSVSAILWGCQASAPNYWTLGAFLRQDWLFWFVMATCFARKRYFGWAGASMVYSALLRVFPGLAVIGWLVVAGTYLIKHKRFRPEHLRTLVGGTAAAAVLVGASLLVVGKDSYQQFYKHTIEVHDQTPLTNHMGLRVMLGDRVECAWPDGINLPNQAANVAQKTRLPSCAGPASGRMQWTQDDKLEDPFEVWKSMRIERAHKYRYLGYALILGTFVFFVAVLRRIKSLWVAQALGQVWIVLLSQLTSYYYSFVIVAAPLTRLRRDLEIWLFGFAAATQIIWLVTKFNDDRYTLLTYATLIFCNLLIAAFAPKSWAFWKPKPAAVAAPTFSDPPEAPDPEAETGAESAES